MHLWETRTKNRWGKIIYLYATAVSSLTMSIRQRADAHAGLWCVHARIKESFARVSISSHGVMYWLCSRLSSTATNIVRRAVMSKAAHFGNVYADRSFQRRKNLQNSRWHVSTPLMAVFFLSIVLRMPIFNKFYLGRFSYKDKGQKPFRLLRGRFMYRWRREREKGKRTWPPSSTAARLDVTVDVTALISSLPVLFCNGSFKFYTSLSFPPAVLDFRWLFYTSGAV